MRRWHLTSAAAVCLTAAAFLGPRLLSGDQEKGPPAAAAPAAAKLAPSKIDKVVVYPNSALVTREVDVPAGAGLVELVVTPMPEQIIPNTMYTEGTNGIRVLTTRFSTRQVLEDTSDERRKLETEKEKYDVIGAKLDSEMVTCQNNVNMLNKLEAVAQNTTRTGDEVIAVAKYVMEGRVERAKEMVALKDKKRLNDVQLNFIARKMSELGVGKGKVEREAIVVVDREDGKAGKVRLNYLVGAVTWRPEYKVRAGKAGEDVQVEYQANLMQHSGEDWGQVKLTLSTAQPMLNATPPELAMLQPILVARGTPKGPPMPAAGMTASPFAAPVPPGDIAKKAMTARDQANQLNAGNFGGGFGGGPGAGKGGGGGPGQPGGFGGNFGGGQGNYALQAQKEADKLLNEASASEQNLELMKSREEIISELKHSKKGIISGPTGSDGPTVTYHLPNKLTVPSRGEEQVIEVVKLAMKPKFYYKTVPVLNTHVYRLADLTNNSSHILLPGEATMYQGTDFVGRMPMPLVAIGEEFTAGFGVDTQLQVQRQMIDQTRSTQGGNQVLKYDYRILISSFKNESVKLQVWDRLPKGETETISITLGKTSPELSKDAIYDRESRPNNLLRWDVEVPGNCNGEKALPITYDFRMELAREMAITGFKSR